MRSNWQIRIFGFVLLAIWGLPLVAGQSPFIEAFSQPLAYLDIEHLYSTYHAIIDFLLFTRLPAGATTAPPAKQAPAGTSIFHLDIPGKFW